VKSTPILFEARRGESLDELELVAEDGTVTILIGYGLNAPERARAREAAMALLGGRTRSGGH
jgi:hypothetical protein